MMRKSFRAFSTFLAAGVSLSALAGAFSLPAGADTPDVQQQQSRVDQLNSKAESLRRESEQLGGSRRPKDSMRTVEGRIRDFTEHADRMEGVAKQMGASKADLDQLKADVVSNKYGEDRRSAVRDAAEDLAKEGLKEIGGQAVKRVTGPAGRVAEVIEEGGKMLFRWRAAKTIQEYADAQAKNAKDALETSLISRKSADDERQKLARLKEIEKENKELSGRIANEGEKLKRMIEAQPGGPATKDANLERERDHPGDERLRQESREYWREKNKHGVTQSRSISFSGGYLEIDAPQQFIGRIVDGGNDFAMIYTPGTLDGFYGEMEAQFAARRNYFLGDAGSFDIGFRYTDVEGDAFRVVEADPALTTGFVFIDPLDPTIPFAVGLGSTNLAWNAHASSSQTGATLKATYREYIGLQYGLDGSIGIGLMGDYRSTEHNTRIENLDFAGFAVDENYDFKTFAFGPRLEGSLEWDCDPEEDGPYPSLEARLRGFVAATYDWRDLEVAQRATGPFFGGFDHRQRVQFDEDGFNLRYGLDATFDLKFDPRTTASVTIGWQAQTDAPTIVPADGSFAPGLRVRADTEDESEWYAGFGLRFDF